MKIIYDFFKFCWVRQKLVQRIPCMLMNEGFLQNLLHFTKVIA